MLHKVVRPEQFCTHTADFFTTGKKTGHFLQPGGINGLRIVVQEADIVTSGFTHGEVIDGGVVEKPRIGQHAGMCLFRCLMQQGKGISIPAVIIHNKDFQLFIVGLVQRLQAGTQQICTITCGNDNGD